jgi:hypothetical protein
MFAAVGPADDISDAVSMGSSADRFKLLLDLSS